MFLIDTTVVIPVILCSEESRYVSKLPSNSLLFMYTAVMYRDKAPEALMTNHHHCTPIVSTCC